MKFSDAVSGSDGLSEQHLGEGYAWRLNGSSEYRCGPLSNDFSQFMWYGEVPSDSTLPEPQSKPVLIDLPSMRKAGG